MIRIEIEDGFNGKQLIQEMKEAGVVLYENLVGISAVLKEADGKVFIPTSEEFAELAQQIATNRVALFEQDTVIERLASVGLSVDDLKSALGL